MSYYIFNFSDSSLVWDIWFVMRVFTLTLMVFGSAFLNLFGLSLKTMPDKDCPSLRQFMVVVGISQGRLMVCFCLNNLCDHSCKNRQHIQHNCVDDMSITMINLPGLTHLVFSSCKFTHLHFFLFSLFLFFPF